MALTLADVRAVVETDIPDGALQRAIDANVEAVNRSAGKADAATDRFRAAGTDRIVLARRALEITEVKERRSRFSDEITLDATDFRFSGDFELTRTPAGVNSASTWGEEVTVSYVPEIDAALRDQVTLKLIEVDVEEGAYDTERVGDWSGSSDWEKKRKRILSRVREGRSPLI